MHKEFILNKKWRTQEKGGVIVISSKQEKWFSDNGYITTNENKEKVEKKVKKDK